MKKLIFLCIAALALSGAAMAQSPDSAQNKPAQIQTLTGNLELIHGVIGLKSDGTSYYIPRLRQLVGFVKEVQEGAAVKVEGYAYPIPKQPGYAFFAVTKLSIAGKDYDLSQDGFGPFADRGMGGRMRGGMRGGMWGGNREGPRGGMGNGPSW
jgi:hypothetical protein